MRDLVRDLAALVWPTRCVGCGEADRELCEGCLAALRRPAALLRRPANVPVLARGRYEGVLRAVLVAYKHGGRTGFGRELGQQLALPLAEALRAVEADPAGRAPPLIVPAPSRRASVRRRGFRHVESLIAVARRELRLLGGSPPPLCRALRSARGRLGQVGLRAPGRRANARRIAVPDRWADRVRGRRIVLVDDIVTTGSTVEGAAAALEKAGATVVAVAVLCLTERRDARGSAACGTRAE